LNVRQRCRHFKTDGRERTLAQDRFGGVDGEHFSELAPRVACGRDLGSFTGASVQANNSIYPATMDCLGWIERSANLDVDFHSAGRPFGVDQRPIDLDA